MFNPILRTVSEQRMVYSTSSGFRVVFALIAGFLVFSSQGQPGVILIILIALSLLGALYLERWVFDKDANMFEKNVGLLFLHTRKQQPLDHLTKIVLREVGPSYQDRPRMMKAVSRQAAILAIVDQSGTNHGLDMIKGSSLREARDSAQKLAKFCDIPFEDLVPQEETDVQQPPKPPRQRPAGPPQQPPGPTA